MQVPNRARRRHHRLRMVAKAIRIFRTYNPAYPTGSPPHDPQKLADNLAFCTKICCRNPRRWRKTDRRFQEIRAGLALDSGRAEN